MIENGEPNQVQKFFSDLRVFSSTFPNFSLFFSSPGRLIRASLGDPQVDTGYEGLSPHEFLW